MTNINGVVLDFTAIVIMMNNDDVSPVAKDVNNFTRLATDDYIVSISAITGNAYGDDFNAITGNNNVFFFQSKEMFTISSVWQVTMIISPQLGWRCPRFHCYCNERERP